MSSKVSFLTVVWGEAHINRFASLALPSFLAPGNIPALAKVVDLEIVIMTQRDDVQFFERHPTCRQLKAICPVRFIEIDDLVTYSNYGVTLTLAYLRPIVRMGEKMLDTHFLFMNADFVLADGSLQSLAKHIIAGRSIVLGPSFRATAEEVESTLRSLINEQNGILAVPPRELTALALAHPHPTTVAKTLNQQFCHSMHPNQFFWQVDDHCMLGHYFLIFMLCLKPERIIQSINSYCDYAFIPELCPSGDEVAMGDSDEFFMLELQQLEQERSLLRLGKPSENEIAQSLQFWTTAEHRRAARHEIVFHSKDLPDELDTFKKEAAQFLDRLESKMGTPRPHADHYYWIHGVVAWKYRRKNQGLTTTPPELAPPNALSKSWLSVQRMREQITQLRSLFLQWSLTLMYQSRPFIRRLRSTPLHPLWLDYRHLKQAIGALDAAPNTCPLFIQDYPGSLDRFAATHFSGRLLNFENLPEQLGTGTGQFTHLVIYLGPDNCRRTQEIVRLCSAKMTAHFNCTVFIHRRGNEMLSKDFSTGLMDMLDNIIGQPPKNVSCSFVGGHLKQSHTRLFLRLSGHYTHFGTPALLWIIPIMTIALPLFTLSNLYLSRNQPLQSGMFACSSLALKFSERKPNAIPPVT